MPQQPSAHLPICFVKFFFKAMRRIFGLQTQYLLPEPAPFPIFPVARHLQIITLNFYS